MVSVQDSSRGNSKGSSDKPDVTGNPNKPQSHNHGAHSHSMAAQYLEKAKVEAELLDHEAKALQAEAKLATDHVRTVEEIRGEEARLKRTLTYGLSSGGLGQEKEKKGNLEEVLEGAEGGGHYTESRWFGGIVAITVLANAIQMGVAADHPEHKVAYDVLEHLFTGIFTIEMLCKQAHLKLKYFFNSWNCLDFGLVWMSIFDCWIIGPALGDDTDLSKLSALRMLRCMRVARMVRLLRVFRELWLIVKGMLDSIHTICWAAGLLLLIIYVFSLFFVRTIGRSSLYFNARNGLPDGEPVDYHPEWDAYENFGNVPRAMFTLFETSLEPLNIRPIAEKQPVMLVFYMIFIFLTTFGIMNVIVGVIVEKCTASAKHIEDTIEIQSKMEKLELLPKLKQVCLELDEDQNGFVTLDEIKHIVRDSSGPVKNIVNSMELPDGCNPDEFCDLLDIGGVGNIPHHVMMRMIFRLLMHSDRQLLLEVKGEMFGLHKMMREILDRQQHHSELLLELCRNGGTLDEIEETQSVLARGLGILQDIVAETWCPSPTSKNYASSNNTAASTAASDPQRSQGCSSIIRLLAEYDSKFPAKDNSNDALQEAIPGKGDDIDPMMVPPGNFDHSSMRTGGIVERAKGDGDVPASTPDAASLCKTPRNLRETSGWSTPESIPTAHDTNPKKEQMYITPRNREGVTHPGVLYSNHNPGSPNRSASGSRKGSLPSIPKEAKDAARGDSMSDNESSIGGKKEAHSLRIPAAKPQPQNVGDNDEGHEKIRTWLSSLDSGGSLMQYYDNIVAHYDSPQQILGIYADGLQHDMFFRDAGVQKVGHKRLFEKWFADAPHEVQTTSVDKDKDLNCCAGR